MTHGARLPKGGFLGGELALLEPLGGSCHSSRSDIMMVAVGVETPRLPSAVATRPSVPHACYFPNSEWNRNRINGLA